MAETEKTILYLEDDEGIRGSFSVGLPLALAGEGLDAELRVFDRVEQLQAAVLMEAMQVLCLLSDLSGVGNEKDPIAEILDMLDGLRIRCPVIFYTGMSPRDLKITRDQQNRLESGGIYFLQKPVSIKEVAAAIKKAVDSPAE